MEDSVDDDGANDDPTEESRLIRQADAMGQGEEEGGREAHILPPPPVSSGAAPRKPPTMPCLQIAHGWCCFYCFVPSRIGTCSFCKIATNIAVHRKASLHYTI